jgi:hypothetical protein
VDTHADTKLGVFRPGMFLETALARDRSRHRVLGPPEGNEERVSLRVDLVAAVFGEGLAQDSLMIRECFAVALAQKLE